MSSYFAREILDRIGDRKAGFFRSGHLAGTDSNFLVLASRFLFGSIGPNKTRHIKRDTAALLFLGTMTGALPRNPPVIAVIGYLRLCARERRPPIGGGALNPS